MTNLAFVQERYYLNPIAAKSSRLQSGTCSKKRDYNCYETLNQHFQKQTNELVNQ
jgi:hypothetical protein